MKIIRANSDLDLPSMVNCDFFNLDINCSILLMVLIQTMQSISNGTDSPLDSKNVHLLVATWDKEVNLVSCF